MHQSTIFNLDATSKR